MWSSGHRVSVLRTEVVVDLIIHLCRVSLLPKQGKETPSWQETHTGQSDQLLNENDQVSALCIPAAVKQDVPSPPFQRPSRSSQTLLQSLDSSELQTAEAAEMRGLLLIKVG